MTVSRTRSARSAALVACLLVPPAAGAQEIKIDADTFGALEARAIGPATMSGRISALDVVAGERLTIYAGAAGGGVWKSTDGGLQVKAIFDKHAQSIGAIAIDPQRTETVWVGTGESCVRNSVSIGDGVYRSTDGGDNWTKLGLEASERIARIAVHPKSSDTVFACATGPAFSSGSERGVFRTKDAGKTWEKVLFVDADTGCSDLVIDPQNPDNVYAGMWQFRRLPWFFTSGGKGSGLYKSSDGGSTWKRLAKGLPEGELGRIALAVPPAKTSVVYATVESKATALYRSDDHGESWTALATSKVVTDRPFYFSHLYADPKDPDRVWKAATSLGVSDDGGKTFATVGGSFHSDVHALWIDPANTDRIVLGTDGGVYVSYDRGARWRFVGSLPVSQYYHVSYDMEYPYNVYGGLQDNSTWYGPSRYRGGIRNKHWSSLTGGDGFWAFPDPEDPDIVYDEYQGGNLFRIRKSTGEAKDIKPSPRQGEPRYRFNWNTPIHLSPSDPKTMYYASQFLFRSRDKGDSWERISPDLTTNDPAKQKQDESGGLTLDNSTAENHCTIFAIAESPRTAGLLWVGTDDGNVQVSRDAGKSWTNVVGNVPGLPKSTWVSSVTPSRFAEGTAYATFDGHMTGDMKTYVYRTRDFGASWQPLMSEALRGYAHVVKEDTVNPELLFLGTELGLFVSVDGGSNWGQFKAGLPDVAVRDLAIHPREHDLVIATHGRGLYILDDLTPLRGLTPSALQAEAAFLESRPQVMFIGPPEFGFEGDTEFVGRSPGEVVGIAYHLKKRHIFGDLRIEVYDEKGARLASLQGGKRRGMNRVDWPLRHKAPRVAAGAGIIPNYYAFLGPRVPAGTYTVKMVKGKETYESKIRTVYDPRSSHSAEDRALQEKTVWELYRLLERLTFVVESITDARDQARARAAARPQKDKLRRTLEALADRLEEQRKALVASKEGEGISGEEKLREEIGMLYGNVNGYEGRPTESQLTRMAVLGRDVDAATARLDALFAKDVAAANRSLAGAKGLEPIARLSHEAWEKRD
jgi:photosystem II stability/assembly factor-like uncharacterized protein